MPARSFQVYKGVRFYNGEKAPARQGWLHCIDADNSGLTFEPWDPREDELDPNAQHRSHHGLTFNHRSTFNHPS